MRRRSYVRVNLDQNLCGGASRRSIGTSRMRGRLHAVPLQNRVTPFSTIEAANDRGLFMGNRGCLHNDQEQLVTQRWRLARWICCQTQFKGRKRRLMSPGCYTELFFLDEATALAAGHRPCAECRRADYRRFLDGWRAATESAPSAAAVDGRLHAEREPILFGSLRHMRAAESLPDGVMVRRTDDNAYLIAAGNFRRWTHAGYESREPINPDERLALITAPTVVEVIRRGYQPVLHPSAAV